MKICIINVSCFSKHVARWLNHRPLTTIFLQICKPCSQSISSFMSAFIYAKFAQPIFRTSHYYHIFNSPTPNLHKPLTLSSPRDLFELATLSPICEQSFLQNPSLPLKYTSNMSNQQSLVFSYLFNNLSAHRYVSFGTTKTKRRVFQEPWV